MVEIAGRPAAGYTAESAAALLDHGKAGSKVKLVIARDGKRKKVKLKLKEFV